MKDTSGWVRQKTVDKAANEIVAERECSAAEVKPYWVAKKLGVNPSGEIYSKVYDWQRRAEAGKSAFAVDVPPEVEAAFRTAVDRFADEMMAELVREYRATSAAVYRAAGLRIADAERARDPFREAGVRRPRNIRRPRRSR